MEHISEILKRQALSATPGARAEEPPEDTPAESVCPACRGARFLHPLLPSGKPDYSRVVPCRCVSQQGESRHSWLQRYSNLGPLASVTFNSIAASGPGSGAAGRSASQARELARTFASQPDGWLVLVGPSGSGKTRLAAAIANQAIASDRPVHYISTPDLLDHLRSSFSPGSDIAYDDLFEQVRNVPLLILDDFGSQWGSPWAKEKLEQLLNHRFIRRLPTVIVSSSPPDDFDERIRTRLTDPALSQVVTLGTRPAAVSSSDWAPGFVLQREMTFDRFDWRRVNLPLEQRDNLRSAFRLAVDFAKSPDGWLLFFGAHGCGKTHLAAAIVNYQYRHHRPALFIVVPDFLDHLRSTFSPDSKISYDQLFESVKNTPLLVLDDLGAQTSTPWAQEKLYQVINHRYNARLATVITTNLSPDQIDSRIVTRLVDQKLSTMFEILAPDYYSGQKRTPRGDARAR